MSKKFDLPDHKSGYRFEGLEINFQDENGQPIPVTGQIRMVFKNKTIDGLTITLSTPDQGITILAPDTWKAQIDPQIINWIAGIYAFELYLVQSGDPVLYAYGQWKILKSVVFSQS